MRKILILNYFLFYASFVFAQDEPVHTTFNFGGYIKADFINTWYMNGDVGEINLLRDVHLPSQIPVGDLNQNFDLDYHVKETRFNFDVKSTVLGKGIHGFIELDFLLSNAGNERYSNSFNPRVRHAYFEWDRLLIGQTWSTFMVVMAPDEIDFSGAMDGLVFVRQPQVRYTAGSWQFALENPETVVTHYQESNKRVTDSEILPDAVIRKNFAGNWGLWSVAGMGRALHEKDTVNRSAFGFGITTGGKLKLGSKGDDLRLTVTYGNGLGRYLSVGFISGAAMNASGDLKPISSFNGYIAYNHFWIQQKLSSSFSLAAFQTMYDELLVSDQVNNSSYSVSGNLKYDPVPQLRFGVEYMYGFRELLSGTNGVFHRAQLAAKYVFGYHNEVTDEKR